MWKVLYSKSVTLFLSPDPRVKVMILAPFKQALETFVSMRKPEVVVDWWTGEVYWRVEQVPAVVQA